MADKEKTPKPNPFGGRVPGEVVPQAAPDAVSQDAPAPDKPAKKPADTPKEK